MKITSLVFKNNSTIPEKYTCEGSNISPPLVFSEVPETAQSLALIMDDPDAPAGLWVHWIIWNIDPQTSGIKEDSTPTKSIVGQNTRGINQYGGPCPPDREHRYFFKLYALDTKLSLTPQSDKNNLEQAMTGHVIEQAELIGLYNKKVNR